MVRREQITDGGRLSSPWWKELMTICTGVYLRVGSWIDDNMMDVIGNGSSALFWYDP